MDVFLRSVSQYKFYFYEDYLKKGIFFENIKIFHLNQYILFNSSQIESPNFQYFIEFTKKILFL